MIPIRLKIEGFLSYRQPVELDFSGFSLACISGHNGAGKSALLDAITWALFGEARKRDEAVINNHPSIKAAEVTLDFDYENNRYRVQRSNPRGKTSSVEFFILSKLDGEETRWKPLTERTLRETDQKIEDTLKMDYETFTNASFFLQGKADQFATARPGERKRILGNVLGLDVWESYRAAASLRRREEEKKVKELEGRLNEIQAELDEEPQRKAHLEELQQHLADLAAQRANRAQTLEMVQRLHASLEEQQKNVETLRLQYESAQRNFERVQSTLEDRTGEQKAYDTVLAKAEAIENTYQGWQKTRADLGTMEELAEIYRGLDAKKNVPLMTINAEKARLQQEKQGLEDQKRALETLVSEKDRLVQQLQTAEEAVRVAEEQLAKGESLEEKVREIQARQVDAKAENARLKIEMNGIKGRIEQLKVAEGVNCPLCGQALSEDERHALMGSLTAEGTKLGDLFRANDLVLEQLARELQAVTGELENLRAAEAALQSGNRQADQVRNKLNSLEAQEENWRKTGNARLAEIAQVLAEESYAMDERKQLAAIGVEMEALGYDADAHAALRQAEQTGRSSEEDFRQLVQARAALAPLRREIEDLMKQKEERQKELENLDAAYQDAVAKLAADQADLPDLSQAEANLFDVQEKENILRKEVGGAEQKVAVLEGFKARKAGYLEEREQITQYIADLKQLERAFGKDGIPALLIEQALPEIAATANELLSRLTNGRMSLRFVTQREYKDTSREDQKETLDMIICDDLGERDYEMFSGGEAFRINFAIRLALSQVLARRAGARLQTLVVDEGFGSQDAQGRQRLVEAINLVSDDFEKILVITHLEELKEAFPTRIEVEKTLEGSKISVV